MFILPFVFTYLFVQFSASFHGSNGIVGLVFGFQKLCFCRCGMPSRSAPRGRLVGPHAHPWLVAVGGARLAGTLISERHVVTAATPVYRLSPSALTVSLGGGALNSSVAAILVHPAYSAGNHGNDIALLKLRHAVPFSESIAPICLPFFASEDFNKVVSVASWSCDELLGCSPVTWTLPLLPPRECAAEVAGLTADKGCLGPVGAKSILCEAAAGGPVMSRWSSGGAYRLLGTLQPGGACAGAAVFTRISDHLLWIRREIREDCQCF